MPGAETRFAVLLFTDIVASTELKARHGVPAYSAALKTHNDHFERIARECRGIRILQNMGDGYFAEAGGVAEAVKFALLLQRAMRDGPWGEIVLATRVGIHAGEVAAFAAESGSGIVAPASDLAARVTSLAGGGQILLTRFPFDEARHFIREHPSVAGKIMPPLRWLAHGPYLLKGRDEPLEIFEVGADGLAPLTAPPDSEKAKRAIRPGEEETLGWRPAVGLEIPGRTGWHLTERLGVGGFGEVWVGEHAKLHQRRAFKFCFDDERLRALKREVTLVRLLRSALGERDDIVHLHELKLDAPPFYLESDLAAHGNLLQWAESCGGLDRIPLAQRIALVAHTGTALAAAHSIGVLHKDIKPTNILIFDGPGGEPRPRLVDFGIGTLADPGVLGQFGVTGAGFTRATIQHSTGTPTYSPPEYLAGKPYTIQGDIYGLGVLLYQLVTGKPLDPLAPGWERDVADPLLREDIAACVDGDPARRLPSATDLAERLLHLDQRRAKIAEKERLAREAAARAEAETAATAARVRATRFRKLAAAFAVLALLALAGGALAWINQKKAAAALGEVKEKNAEVEAKKAEVDRKNTEYRAMLVEAARSDRFVAEENLRAGKEREAFAHLARACEYDPSSTLAAEQATMALSGWQHPLLMAILVSRSGNMENLQFSPDGTRIATASYGEGVHFGQTVTGVWDAATGKSLATLQGGEAQFNRDSTLILTLYGKTRVWDAATGKSLGTLAPLKGRPWRRAQFSPDRTRIVTTSSDKDALVWEAATGNCLATLSGHETRVMSAQFSPDGTLIVTTSFDKDALVWDAITGKSFAKLSGHEDSLNSAQFSLDGTRIVTASVDRTARVWDAATGKTLTILSGHNDSVESARFSPHGSRIVTASADKTARVWVAATGESLATLAGHENRVRGARFSPDGTRIVTVSDDKTARLWDLATGKSLATIENDLESVQFSPDGTRILTGSGNHARLWDLGKTLGHEQRVVSAEFSPDGTRVVTATWEKTRVWDVPTGKMLATLATLAWHGGLNSAQFSPDGTRIVTASDPTAWVWDAATGKSLATLLGHEARVNSAQFSPDGTRIVTASRDKTARVWDTATGKSLTILSGHEDGVDNAQFSPDGTRIVTKTPNLTARVWDAATGKSLATLQHANIVWSAQFSPGSACIVTASGDKTAQVWEAATGKRLATLPHQSSVNSAQFSPDGTRIVTASDDKIVRVWDAATGKTLVTLVGHEDDVKNAQFGPDGTRIVTASADKTARIWDAATGKCLVTLAGYENDVTNAQFSPDGTHIVTVSAVVERYPFHSMSSPGTARVWEVLPSGPPPEWFPDFLRYMAQMRLNPNGKLEALKPDDWLALRERMRAVRRGSAEQDTPYLRILRRFVPE